MDNFLSAVLGDLTSRSMNFIMNKCSRLPAHTMEKSLQRAIIRAQVIIDESMGRAITNQAMLLQLNMLRDAMHRGHYVLDTFRCQPHDEEEAKNQSVSPYSSLSIAKSAKRLCFSSGGALCLKELQETLNNLSSMILGVNELVLFLTSYPRMYRQPYSMHFHLANCMFGRKMEAQLVINFLLHIKPYGDEELEVLPIVGPSYVGKSTLVAHVCKDERVRAHFSEILFFHIQSFTDDELATFRDECEAKHKNPVSKTNLEGRLLVVIELTGYLNEDAWSRLYSASRRYVPSGGKIILTSRFDNNVKFGTTRALTLNYMSHEAYWYFFKTLAFGSTDPMMHPRLMYLAMNIAREMKNSIIFANITTRLLKNNFDAHFWWKVLTFLRGSFQKHVSISGEHPFDLLDQNKCGYFGRIAKPSEVFVVYHQYQRSTLDEVPKVSAEDAFYGSVKPHGKFEGLAWRSSVPPYYSYIGTCEIQELKTTAVKRKRSVI